LTKKLKRYRLQSRPALTLTKVCDRGLKIFKTVQSATCKGDFRTPQVTLRA